MRGSAMRGSDTTTGSLFSYVDVEGRIPARHPLRLIRAVVNEALAALDAEFARIYAAGGRPSIAPEKLLRALLLQVLYTIRSERLLMEQLDYNLLFRWFVGLGPAQLLNGRGPALLASTVESPRRNTRTGLDSIGS